MISRTKFVLDDVNWMLAGRYGPYSMEPYCIINYDIRYRIGRDSKSEYE